jgi:transcriptional regulator with XRE-family HTH domain
MADYAATSKRGTDALDRFAGQLCKVLREDPESGYGSQGKLGEAIKRSRQWVLLFESGRAPLDLTTLERLARAFGVDPGRLAAAIFRGEMPPLKELRARRPLPGGIGLRWDLMDSKTRKQVLEAVELAQKIRTLRPGRRQALEKVTEEWWQDEREMQGLGRRPGMRLIESHREVHKGMRKLGGDPKFIEQVEAGKRPRRGRKK